MAGPFTVVARQLVMEAVPGQVTAAVFEVVKVTVPGPLGVVGIGPASVAGRGSVMEAVHGPVTAAVFWVIKVAVPGPLIVMGIGRARVAVRGLVMVAGLGLATVALLGAATVTGFTKGGVFSARVLASMASAIRGGGTIRTIRITAAPIMAELTTGIRTTRTVILSHPI